MYLVLLLAAGAILVGVVVVAMGRGGEMASFSRDAPIAFTAITGPADVATLRLPMALFGYQVQATTYALTLITSQLAQRDYEIAALRGEIWRLEACGAGEHRADQRADADLAGTDLPCNDLGSTDLASTDLASTEQTGRQ